MVGPLADEEPEDFRGNELIAVDWHPTAGTL